MIETFVLRAQEGSKEMSYDQRLQISQLFQMNLEESLQPDLFELLQSDFQEDEESLEKPIDIKMDTNLEKPQRIQFR